MTQKAPERKKQTVALCRARCRRVRPRPAQTESRVPPAIVHHPRDPNDRKLTIPPRSHPLLAAAKAPLPAVIDGAPTGGGGGGARKRKGKAAADGLAEKMASAAAVGDDDVDMDENAGGKTLGERLRAIEQTAADAPIDGTAPPEKQKLTATDRAVLDALGGKGAPPKADSLATLLSQALVAEDRALVERCLNVSDAQTVNNTVARLQPHVAVRLLNAALDRMRTKPTRGEQLARWMRTVMLHHAGYITTSAKAQRSVMELQQTVEAHVAMQRPLLGLLGRLDLLLHKRQQVPDGEDGVDGTGDGGEGPLTVYAEGEDDVNVLNEVVGNEESDDDEWETDDEKDEDDEGFDDEDDDDDEDGEDMEDDFDGEDDDDE